MSEGPLTQLFHPVWQWVLDQFAARWGIYGNRAVIEWLIVGFLGAIGAWGLLVVVLLYVEGQKRDR